MRPDRAMVLAAGLGLRMRPLTTLVPKPVLPVMGRPLVGHLLDHLVAHGVRCAVVNAHHQADLLEEALGSAAPSGLEVIVSRETEILGTAGGLGKAKRHFRGGPFYLVNSDSLTDVDLTAAWRAHAASGRLATLIVKEHDPASGYRPVTVLASSGDTARVRGFAGSATKPAPGSVPRTFTGVHLLQPEVLDAIPACTKSDIVADVYPRLMAADADAVGAWLHGGFWFEAGSPGRYLDLNLAMLERSAAQRLVQPGARVAPSATVEGSIVGAGARVDDGAVVAGSVLWDGSVVERGARLERCVVTAGAVARAGGSWRETILMAGDAGSVEAHPLARAAGP